MAKSFYSLEEACEKLSMTEDQIKELVRNAQLREFRDAGKVNYKVDEIDAIAAASGTEGPGASGELVLEPAEDSGLGGSVIGLADSTPGLGSGIDLEASSPGLGSDVLSLDEADLDDTKAGEQAPKKDDTVVSSIGVSVFDEDADDLIDVDPLAATVVTEGAIGLGIEGIGSGSGLLDLTRESDDTSLGADLLDEIYPEDEAPPVEMGDATRAGLEEAITEEPEDKEATTTEPFESATSSVAAARTRTVVEYGPDPISTGLTGMMAVGVAVMCVAGLGAASIMQGVWPSLLNMVYENLWIFGAGSLGLSLAAMGVGVFVGKRSAG